MLLPDAHTYASRKKMGCTMRMIFGIRGIVNLIFDVESGDVKTMHAIKCRLFTEHNGDEPNDEPTD